MEWAQFYLMKNINDGNLFAVKVTILQGTKKLMFLDELEVWIGLPSHPNIAACRFFRTFDDNLLIFSEYVDGGSLLDWIRGEKITSVEQILDIAIQFAWGLYVSHEHRVIHQDVKPANVLITKDGIVKICDFGLAKVKANIEERQGLSTKSALC